MLRFLALLLLVSFPLAVRADDLPTVKTVEAQPLLAQVKRLVTALDSLGQPLPDDTQKTLAALVAKDGDAAVAKVQELLDAHCFAAVEIDEKGVAKVIGATRKPELVEQGWRTYPVKVINKPGATGQLKIDSPSAKPVPKSPQSEVDKLWLSLLPVTAQPMLPNLSGLGLEYTLVQIYSRDAGERSADISFRVEGGKGLKPGPTPSSASATIAFTAKVSIPVTFKVTEFDGKPTTAAFLIRDTEGRVYPAQAKRLAPDFFFQPQVYRSSGETVRLPAGKYRIACSRGPESIPEMKDLIVADKPVEVRYSVARWIDPAKGNWYSGDHHIHAAGCLHYEKPTEGVEPKDMMRHIVGEDVKVGCCLTWGPCFDYQKRFFTGKPDDVSKLPYLLRYDVEVSGFGSHASGHLNLLNLTEQIYPGGTSKDHWPTLGMNTLRWAKKQGGICGPAHSASGLTRTVGRIEGAKDGPGGLPSFDIPAYDGIGANEFIVDVTHEVPGPDGKPVPAIDFISTMNTQRKAEWTMWYHVLNCGYRVRASGETDFPCITGDRVGLGRVYAKVDGELTFEKWVKAVQAGRSYISDGATHFMNPTATAGDKKYDMGVNGSEIKLDKAGKISLTVQAAAWYPGKKTVPVELIVNGLPVETQELPCDGKTRDLTFTAEIGASSWVAIRIIPTGHTNPFFVIVEGKPIRASKQSAEWCLAGVEQCWKSKAGTYAKDEKKQAEADYDHARKTYKAIIAESGK